MHLISPIEASKCILEGKIIIYPTEGIFGIGCDPFNEDSINNIYKLKSRNFNKKFILVCSKLEHLKNIVNIDFDLLKDLNSKNKFTTWVAKATNNCPYWLNIDKKVAFRVSEHDTIKKICNKINRPLISTSANKSNDKYVNDIEKIKKIFKNEIEYIVDGSLGGLNKPSKIIDFETLRIIRK